MADQNDLTQNVNIWNDEKSKAVTVTTDGSKERLDVNAKFDGSISVIEGKYRLQLETHDGNIDFLDDTWHTIFTVSVAGKPNYLWTEFYNGNYEIRITMDGEVVWQLNNSQMGGYDLSDGNQTRYQPGVLYRRSVDVISWHFSPSLTFDTEFKYEVRRRSGTSGGFDRGILQWEKKY